MFNELPMQLRPNFSGLTEDQFKVYQDFSKLSFKSKYDQVPMGNTGLQSEGQNDVNKQKPPAQYDFGLDSIIGRLMEDKPLSSVTRSLLTIKIN